VAACRLRTGREARAQGRVVESWRNALKYRCPVGYLSVFPDTKKGRSARIGLLRDSVHFEQRLVGGTGFEPVTPAV
ncbi:MAG: hypothetical protein KGO02_15375, partial [Alphaproteobacteria bacterium]|nr:hypothetical protein [Alphaproteobacteria bacterium]